MLLHRCAITFATLVLAAAACEGVAAPAGDEIGTGKVVFRQSGGLEALDSTIAELEQVVRNPPPAAFYAESDGKPQTLETILADLYAARERLRAEQAAGAR
jgi:hypothetical protein